MSFISKASSILGINARNLHYIGRYNSRKAKKFADNKIYTKNYLSSRGVGVAKVFNIVKNNKELHNFDPKSLPKDFVIKPNRGFGGEGILVITEKKGNNFIDISGKQYSWKDIYRHILTILDGKYAISGLSDQAIIEERLVMHEQFNQYTDAGLPDVRVIVFNYVPVIAMLRLPVPESKGKANLHLGAIGAGIDISTGRANFAVQYNKFIRKLPNGEKVSSIKIPNWDNVLLTAAKAQHASQIGFLAVDIVITTTGVKILELNARAGLSVQIANQIPLKARLKKVSDLKVPNPEKGVEVSKALFSSNIPTEKKEKEKDKPVIGLFERIDILNSKLKDVVAKIDPHSEEVFVDESLVNKIKKKSKDLISIKIKGKRVDLPVKFVDFSKEKFKVVIAGKFLTDFLIDLSWKKIPETKKIKIKKDETVDGKIIQSIDKKIFNIESKFNTVGALRPTNLDQEKNNFFNNPTKSPHFFYKKTKVNVAQFKKELDALPREIDHPLAKIYLKKIDEVKKKLNLLEAVDSSELQSLSEQLYGKADKILYDQAVRYIHDNPIESDDSEILNTKKIVKRLEEFLKKNKLSGWKIKMAEDRTADIAVNKNGTIFLRDGVKFSENRLKAVIVHEIGTHVFRLENGKLQNYKIFEKGTAGYLTTEEGLAIYNQKALNLPLGEKDIWPALRAIGAYLADEMSFVDMFHYMKENYNLNDESAWKTCLKAKRGLVDTSKKAAFTRDVIYFRGYLQVKDYLEKNPEHGLKNLYIGKVGINDLQFFGDLSEYKVRYLPF